MWLKRFLLALLITVALIWSLWLPKSDSGLDTLLLCPVCSGQTVFESNHPIAIQMNHFINVWQKDGLSANQIIEQLQMQYGDNIMGIELVLTRLCFYIFLFIVGLKYAYQKKH